MGVGEQTGAGMFTVDDFRVGIAAAMGLSSWVVNIDVIVQLCISVASLTYIVLKIIEHFKKRK